MQYTIAEKSSKNIFSLSLRCMLYDFTYPKEDKKYSEICLQSFQNLHDLILHVKYEKNCPRVRQLALRCFPAYKQLKISQAGVLASFVLKVND